MPAAPRAAAVAQQYGFQLSSYHSPPRIDGHRPARAQRPQLGRDLVGELLIVFHDQQRGRDLLRLGDQLGVPKEQLGQQDGTLVIGQPSFPGAHSTIMPPG